MAPKMALIMGPRSVPMPIVVRRSRFAVQKRERDALPVHANFISNGSNGGDIAGASRVIQMFCSYAGSRYG